MRGRVGNRQVSDGCSAGFSSTRHIHDGIAPDLLAVVNHYDTLFGLNRRPIKADLVSLQIALSRPTCVLALVAQPRGLPSSAIPRPRRRGRLRTVATSWESRRIVWL
jgi:hypothetical protein